MRRRPTTLLITKLITVNGPQVWHRKVPRGALAGIWPPSCSPDPSWKAFLTMRRTPLAALVVSVSLITALVGCSTTAAGPATGDSTIRLVASTNVYGDIASQIGGDRVSVTSIITDPSQDPHSYEADAQVQLALSKANVVVQNGGHYDDFVDTLLTGANNPDVTLIDASKISGYDQKPRTGEFNEHVWYDLPTMMKLTKKLKATFSRLDPRGAQTFAANTAAFMKRLALLKADQQAAAAANGGTSGAASGGVGVAITEPVPLYLLDAMGLQNKTPAAFSEAIEAGTDVSPLVLRDTLALFSKREVRLLAYNEQTSGAETEQVLAAAKAAGIASVAFTETLPAGDDYISWMTQNIAAVTAALK